VFLVSSMESKPLKSDGGFTLRVIIFVESD
jgi:hypothetical protein